jgi:hypothetical protein
MSKTDSLHYQLCCLGAKFLKSRKNAEPWEMPNKYIAVEIVSLTAENPDIWATNGYQTTLVEVKTSHSDFIADKKKWCRSSAAEIADKQLGNYRYYLCPEGIINIDEVPEKWGLLVYDGKKIIKVKNAIYQKSSTDGELTILCSIMRRCGIKSQIFNFRKNESH